jgi:WD40 repeat protein
MERPTRTPKQANTIILDSRFSTTELSFSQTDSNILASGGPNGEIKVWNIKERACIHSFESHGGRIRSLFFAGGADIACLAATRSGSVIRLRRAQGSPNLSSETMGEIDRRGRQGDFTRVLISPSGSFLATILLQG